MWMELGTFRAPHYFWCKCCSINWPGWWDGIRWYRSARIDVYTHMAQCEARQNAVDPQLRSCLMATVTSGILATVTDRARTVRTTPCNNTVSNIYKNFKVTISWVWEKWSINQREPKKCVILSMFDINIKQKKNF